MGVFMNRILATKKFWQGYFSLEGLSAAEVDAQLEGLGRDFAVVTERHQYESNGRRTSFVSSHVEFCFDCGKDFSLVVEYEPEVNGSSINLLLVDRRDGKRHAMGWWDLARWHPYCLRPEELEELLRFWGGSGAETNVRLLLLCPFVGLESAEARDALLRRAEAAYSGLGLSAIEGGSSWGLVRVPEDGYRWELDGELGWVFTSDEYCCYSIRNRPHLNGSEGWFPFDLFEEMMAGVRERLG
jgi:hypothetical protein